MLNDTVVFTALWAFVGLAGVSGALLLAVGLWKVLNMGDLANRLRERGAARHEDKKASEGVAYGPVEAFDYRIDGRNDGPANYPAIVIQMAGKDIVAVTFMGQGLPFMTVQQPDKNIVAAWKQWYRSFAAGRITQIKGFKPKPFGGAR